MDLDFRKIRQKPDPAAGACGADSRCDQAALSDNDLEQVSGSGETGVPTMNPEVLLGRHARPDDAEERMP